MFAFPNAPSVACHCKIIIKRQEMKKQNERLKQRKVVAYRCLGVHRKKKMLLVLVLLLVFAMLSKWIFKLVCSLFETYAVKRGARVRTVCRCPSGKWTSTPLAVSFWCLFK